MGRTLLRAVEQARGEDEDKQNNQTEKIWFTAFGIFIGLQGNCEF